MARFIQCTDGYYYADFRHQLDGIVIKSEVVSSVYKRDETIRRMNLQFWFCKLTGPQKARVVIDNDNETATQWGTMWSVEWIDVIPIPAHARMRIAEPTSDFQVFVIRPTEEELLGIKEGNFSLRIKMALGGEHLSLSSLKRRLKTNMLDGVIYAR